MVTNMLFVVTFLQCMYEFTSFMQDYNVCRCSALHQLVNERRRQHTHTPWSDKHRRLWAATPPPNMHLSLWGTRGGSIVATFPAQMLRITVIVLILFLSVERCGSVSGQSHVSTREAQGAWGQKHEISKEIKKRRKEPKQLEYLNKPFSKQS